MTLVNLAEYEEAARAKLRREAYDYYAGGANDEVTLRANREAYGRLALYHRVLRDVAVRDTSVELLGDRISLPVMVAPTAFQRMACDEGECACSPMLSALSSPFTPPPQCHPLPLPPCILHTPVKRQKCCTHVTR